MRTAYILQHTKGSPPGSAKPWLKRRGFRVDHRHLYAGAQLPNPRAGDVIILCGGGFHIDADRYLPWFAAEKAALRDWVRRPELKILGICLGGQMLAETLGAKVGPHPKDWEAGWQKMHLSVHPRLAGFEAPWTLPVFQWHRYVFDCPESAVNLARNDWWECQAFLWKDRVLGFQYHPETDLDGCRARATDPELPQTGLCQSPQTILELSPVLQPRMQGWFERVLEGFLFHSSRI